MKSEEKKGSPVPEIVHRGEHFVLDHPLVRKIEDSKRRRGRGRRRKRGGGGRGVCEDGGVLCVVHPVTLFPVGLSVVGQLVCLLAGLLSVCHLLAPPHLPPPSTVPPEVEVSVQRRSDWSTSHPTR